MVKIMAGTACILNDYSNDAGNKSRNIDLLSAWLFGKLNTDCLLTDISKCGGSVLVPKKQIISSESFDLVIMSPENKEKVLTVLQAEQRWEDKEYSTLYKKIGVKFQNIDQVNIQAINTVIELFIQQKNTSIKCNLLNR
jgi:hypothetical protein